MFCRSVAPYEKSNEWRRVCSVSAAAASAQTSGVPAPIASPANAAYSFERSKTESSQAPNLEKLRV